MTARKIVELVGSSMWELTHIVSSTPENCDDNISIPIHEKTLFVA